MQTKDIVSQPLSTEWAVVSPNAYVRKGAVTSKLVTRRETYKAKLVSYNTYEQTHCISDNVNDPRFVQTTSDRTKRFLMATTDEAGTVRYWVCPASNFVDLYSNMEASWSTAEAEQAKKEAEKATKDAIRFQAIAQAESRKDAIVESINENVKALLGHAGYMGYRSDICIEGDWKQAEDGSLTYEPRLEGTVILRYDQFMRLVEKFNQLQD